jgi:hypothetical protein
MKLLSELKRDVLGCIGQRSTADQPICPLKQQHLSTERFEYSQDTQRPWLRTLRNVGANDHNEAVDVDSYGMACQQQGQKVLFSPSFYRLEPWAYSASNSIKKRKKARKQVNQCSAVLR